jgi:hypothetical protein
MARANAWPAAPRGGEREKVREREGEGDRRREERLRVGGLGDKIDRALGGGAAGKWWQVGVGPGGRTMREVVVGTEWGRAALTCTAKPSLSCVSARQTFFYNFIKFIKIINKIEKIENQHKLSYVVYYL